MDSNSTWSSAGRGVILGSLHLAPSSILLGLKHRIILFLPPPAGCTTWQTSSLPINTLLFMDLGAPEDVLRPSNLTGHDKVSSGLAADSLSLFFFVRPRPENMMDTAECVYLHYPPRTVGEQNG
jgi:hypothetical protein